MNNSNTKVVDFLEGLKKRGIQVLCALPQETNGVEGINYIGLGKINAAINTSTILSKYNPKLVINYGSCGGLNKQISGLVEITKFKQHDIDCTPLGFDKGITPYDDIQDIELSSSGYTCASGDYFVSDGSAINADVVDMEAYSIAKVCLLNNIEFKCFKFISDSADDAAATDWETNCADGFKLFIEKMKLLNLK